MVQFEANINFFLIAESLYLASLIYFLTTLKLEFYPPRCGHRMGLITPKPWSTPLRKAWPFLAGLVELPYVMLAT